MLAQDSANGVAYALFDIEDRLTDPAASYLTEAKRDFLLIDPTNTDYVVPLNVLHVPQGIHPYTVVEGVLGAFRRAWPDAWGPRLEDLLRNCLRLLMEHNCTLGELLELISNDAFRAKMVKESKNQRTKLFFEGHLKGITSREYRTWIESTRNKVSALMSNPFIAPALSAETCIDPLHFMDNGIPILVRVTESVLGDSGRLLAMLIVALLYQAALRRAPGSRPFYIYADEYQNLATRAFLDLCTRSRKRGVGSVVAHQSIFQPPFDKNPEYVSTMLANTAVQVVFQVGREDAERFAKEIFPATGTQPKRRAKHWLWGDYGPPQFYSIQEEREAQCRELETQKQRECFIKIRKHSGFQVYAAEVHQTPEPISAWEYDASKYGIPINTVREGYKQRIARFATRRRSQKA